MARRQKPLERQLESLWKVIDQGGMGGGTQGPPGPKGEKGDPGERGEAGPTGPAGAPGQPGSAGAQGPKGDTGNTGPAGPKGDSGDFGPQGDQGPIGLTGPKGDKGDRGEIGPAGPQGDDGPTGQTGQTGLTGQTGSAGPKGDKGDKGDTGLTGPAGPAGSFVSLTAALGGDVQISGNNTFVDGPSLVLPAGTWLVSGQATFQRNATTAVHWVARISDGTNHHASGQTYQPSLSGHTASIALSAVVTLAVQTTVKLQGAISAGSTTSLMKAATPNASSGNNATRLNAVKIA